MGCDVHGNRCEENLRRMTQGGRQVEATKELPKSYEERAETGMQAEFASRLGYPSFRARIRKDREVEDN